MRTLEIALSIFDRVTQIPGAVPAKSIKDRLLMPFSTHKTKRRSECFLLDVFEICKIDHIVIDQSFIFARQSTRCRIASRIISANCNCYSMFFTPFKNFFEIGEIFESPRLAVACGADLERDLFASEFFQMLRFCKRNMNSMPDAIEH